MKEYQVTAKQVTLTAGLLKLTAEQAKPRAHALKATDKVGVFEILQPVSFKAGEVFSWDGQLGKALADDLTPSEEVKQPEPANAPEAEKRRGRKKKGEQEAGGESGQQDGEAEGGKADGDNDQTGEVGGDAEDASNYGGTDE